MRRADRLFQIIQLLRRGKVLTAEHLAQELEVSKRTVYRDIRDLIVSGVPVQGEAGVGYTLSRHYDLPPLQFTTEELEALILGARLVTGWGDSNLSKGANSILDKVSAAIPRELSDEMMSSRLYALNFAGDQGVATHMAPLRKAIKDQHKVRISYKDSKGEPSERTVHPLCLSFFAPLWMLTAWCELRQDFRNFRLDRIVLLTPTTEAFPHEKDKSIETFFALMEKRT